METKLRVLVEKNMLPGVILKQNKIILTYPPLKELGMDIGLKSLAEMLGLEYKVIRVGRLLVKGIEITFEKLLETLTWKK